MDPTLIRLQTLIQQVNNLQEEIDIADEIIENLFEDNDVLLEYALNEKKQWIQQAIKKPGALRKSMKVKEGKNIPSGKLEKAAETSAVTVGFSNGRMLIISLLNIRLGLRKRFSLLVTASCFFEMGNR